MDVRVGPQRKLRAKELMLLNCSVGEDPWQLLGLQGDQTCQSNQSIPKGNQSWIFIAMTDAEGKAPILWPPDVKSLVIRKDLDAGTDWGQEKKGTTEDEMVGWHHRLHGHEFEQAPGVGDGQGGLACCSPWGRRVRHDWATEQQQRGLSSGYSFKPFLMSACARG